MNWGVFGLLVVGVVIGILEVPLLLKKNLKKELCVFFILLVLGIGLNTLLAYQINVKSPIDFISVLYEPLTSFINQLVS